MKNSNNYYSRSSTNKQHQHNSNNNSSSTNSNSNSNYSNSTNTTTATTTTTTTTTTAAATTAAAAATTHTRVSGNHERNFPFLAVAHEGWYGTVRYGMVAPKVSEAMISHLRGSLPHPKAEKKKMKSNPIAQVYHKCHT